VLGCGGYVRAKEPGFEFGRACASESRRRERAIEPSDGQQLE